MTAQTAFVATQSTAPAPAVYAASVPIISNSAPPVSYQGKSNNKSYLQRSVEQVVYGNYTDEVTLLGTAAQVLMGVFNIDVLADIRDLSADFVNWEWSGQHLFQTSTDLVAVLPLLGVAKYTDEAAALVKNAGKNKKIFMTGKEGEKYLALLVGGKSQQYMSTSLGRRFVDQLSNGIAHESKVGYTTLTKRVRIQILKDSNLIDSGKITGAHWHFFTSGVTGKGGVSQPLLDFLTENGIEYTIH